MFINPRSTPHKKSPKFDTFRFFNIFFVAYPCICFLLAKKDGVAEKAISTQTVALASAGRKCPVKQIAVWSGHWFFSGVGNGASNFRPFLNAFCFSERCCEEAVQESAGKVKRGMSEGEIVFWKKLETNANYLCFFSLASFSVKRFCFFSCNFLARSFKNIMLSQFLYI